MHRDKGKNLIFEYDIYPLARHSLSMILFAEVSVSFSVHLTADINGD